MKKALFLLSFFVIFTSNSVFAATKAPTTIGNFIYISTEGEIIHNGKSLGYGANLVTNDEDFAYEKIVDAKIHIIFNGNDLGEGYRPQIDEGKLLYEKEEDFVNLIMFDGKSLGEGYDPILKDGHVVFFRKIQGNNLRNNDQGIVQAYYDGVYYCDAKDDSIKKNIQFAGDKVICEQSITSKGITKTFIIYQGKVIDEGTEPHVSKNHYEYSKNVTYGDRKYNMIVFDGKTLGEGKEFEFSEESYLYIRSNVNGKDEIVFNGASLGEFNSKSTIFLKDGHIAFQRDRKITERDSKGQSKETVYTYIYHDGIEKGIIDLNAPIFLAGNHIAFERTVKGYDYDLEGKTKEVDVTYAVYDGRERTSIEKGTLQMDDTGVFAFAKIQNEFDTEEATGQKDEYGNALKGKYVDKIYIYRGETSGAISRFTVGDPKSIVVKDGRVAYIKPEKEKQIMKNDQGNNVDVEVQITTVMIDGVKKGDGDIATLVMDQGQYAFAKNKKGRPFLNINGKEQAFPGSNIHFLKTKKTSTTTTESSSLTTSGILKIMGNSYFLQTEKEKLQIIPNEKQSLQKYKGKKLYVNLEKKLFRSKTTGKTVSAYKLVSFSLKALEKSSTTKKIYKGVLQKNVDVYSLKDGGTIYPITLGGSINASDLSSFVGDTVQIEAVLKDGKLEVNALPQ